MSTTLIKSIRNLSATKRMKLMEDIWETFHEADDFPKLTAAQEKMLQQRLAAHRAHPDRSMSFDEFKKKMAGAKAAFKQRDKSRGK